MARRKELENDLDALDLEPLERGQGLAALVSARLDIAPGSEEELSDDEEDELERCEAIIERGLHTFFEVGAALIRVRDLRLYRSAHPTFEAYCQDRWSISRPRAYQFIQAAEVRHNLSTNVDILPANEAQTRPLTRLDDPEQQREAWQRAVSTAPAGRITAAHVRQIVREMLGTPEAPAAASTPTGYPVTLSPAAYQVVLAARLPDEALSTTLERLLLDYAARIQQD